MSYLLTQMFLYMIVAFLLGLILGWLIWRYSDNDNGDAEALRAENDRLRADLDACGKRCAGLQSENDNMRGEMASMSAAPAAVAPMTVADLPDTAPVEEAKPEGLTGPRGGRADELQLINGVGPKMENLLHSLGYYHFDQIAAWSRSEVAWVDNNLEGFKGRVTRDSWQAQAKQLARG